MHCWVGKILLLLFSCLLVVSGNGDEPNQTTSSSTIGGDVNMAEEYIKINKYLEENCAETDSVNQDMESIVQWLSSLQAVTTANNDKNLVAALEQLVAIKQTVRGENKCREKAYKILLENDVATGGRTHMMGSQLPHMLNRVEKIIHLYATKHAKICQSIYPSTFKALAAKTDSKITHRLSVILRNIVSHIYFANKSADVLNSVSGILYRESIRKSPPIINQKNYAEVAYEALKELSAHDSGRKFLEVQKVEFGNNVTKWKVHKNQFKRLFKLYIGDTCEYFVREMGPNVFTPAIYDSAMISVAPGPHDDFNFMFNYYFYWSGFRVCELLINGRVNRETFIQNMINVAVSRGKEREQQKQQQHQTQTKVIHNDDKLVELKL